MTLLNMDLHDTPDTLGFDPIPAGDYTAQIVDTEIAHSKAEELMLSMSWLIMEGDHAERLVFDRVMLSGSDKAVAFGKRKVKTIATAVGHPNPNRVEDSEELHGLPCLITVAIREWNGENRNEVKNYKPLTAPQPQVPAAPPAQAQAPAPPATRMPPPPAPPKTGATPPPPRQGQARPQTPFDPPAGGDV